MANEILEGVRESEQEALEETALEAASELRRAAPRSSGELARGIAADGIEIVMPEHGMWIDRRRGRHTGWIERATDGEVIY